MMTSKFKKIYFVGIKGVGMTSLAIIAKEAGFDVLGSDIKDEFITDHTLKDNGIYPLVGFSIQNFDRFVGSSSKEEVLVISTSAHGGFENIETKYARDNGFRVLTHGQAVGEFMKGDIFGRGDLEGISVAGAHGKTTISAMLATVCTKLSLDPSYTVGTSHIFPIGNPGHYGKGNYFIAEADEYVSEPQYDKTPKFLYQHPRMAILNNIDFDHPDFYKDINAVEYAFSEFIQHVKPYGTLLINGDNERLLKVAKQKGKRKIITYGTSDHNDFYLNNFQENGLKSWFKLETQKVSLGQFELSVPGFHNAKNSLPVIALLLELGISPVKIKQILPTFLGTKRRLEIVGDLINGATLIDDYAHHPLEIKTTLSAVKTAFPGKKIICVFQPHTYSRTKALFTDFVSSFYDADDLILLPIYASQREKVEKVDKEDLSQNLYREIQKIKPSTLFFNEHDYVIEYIRKVAKNENFVVLTMGAGDVYKINLKLKT